MGSESFAQGILKQLKHNHREQPEGRRVGRPPGWEEIVRAVERLKGEKWKLFSGRRGDWGRDAALWLGRRVGRLGLADLAQKLGCDYTTVGKAVSRFGQRLKTDAGLARKIGKLRTGEADVKFQI